MKRRRRKKWKEWWRFSRRLVIFRVLSLRMKNTRIRNYQKWCDRGCGVCRRHKEISIKHWSTDAWAVCKRQIDSFPIVQISFCLFLFAFVCVIEPVVAIYIYCCAAHEYGNIRIYPSIQLNVCVKWPRLILAFYHCKHGYFIHSLK